MWEPFKWDFSPGVDFNGADIASFIITVHYFLINKIVVKGFSLTFVMKCMLLFYS